MYKWTRLLKIKLDNTIYIDDKNIKLQILEKEKVQVYLTENFHGFSHSFFSHQVVEGYLPQGSQGPPQSMSSSPWF